MNLAKLISFLLVVSAYILPLKAQESIPEFKAVDLNDEEVVISNSKTGKKALVGFAFSQKAQEDLDTWIQPVYDEFIDENSLASLVYDVDVYLVIVFNSVNSNFKKRVEKELKENVLQEFFGNVLLCDEKSGEIRDKLNIDDDNVPSLFALDSDGRILERTTGRYTEKKLEKLSDYLEIE